MGHADLARHGVEHESMALVEAFETGSDLAQLGTQFQR
jgi:hypothetical protein